ncbi:MAG: ABC transporter ATP-binding protein [Candidatus Eremiobacterota bacterium]
MAPVVELQSIFMNFDTGNGKTLRASVDVNMTINEREIITVVGESGCGKSTIGKICLGVQKPSSGKVLFNGTDIWGPKFKWSKEYRLMVQVVHQDSYASLNPVKTIDQILSDPFLFHRIAKNSSEAHKKVIDLLNGVGLTPADYFANKYPFQLSGGQRQRVSIARATILKPKLIITDEPVSGVDSSLRIAILDLMRKLNEDHCIAFLYITHDLATARYFGKGGKIIVMYLGHIVEEGDVGEVIDNPRHPYLQALLSALPPPDPKKAKIKKELPLKSLDMPDPTDPPPGCPFNPRCPYSEEICTGKNPERISLEKDKPHFVACHFEKTKIPLWK